MFRSHIALLGLATTVAILTTGCATTYIEHDFDPTRDLSHLRTFHVMEAPLRDAGRSDPRVVTPFASDRIHRAITTYLERRGYKPVAREKADVLIGYHFAVDRRLDVRAVNSIYGFGARHSFGRHGRHGGFGHGGGVTRVLEYDEGTLIIDVAERESMVLAWRGWGSARLGRRPDPVRTSKVINRIVPEILAQFPPQPQRVPGEA